jgi:hypothetical protein
MDKLHGLGIPASAPGLSAARATGVHFAPQFRQACRRLTAWRPVLSVESLLLLASLAFSTFYNHALWHLLFG